MISSKTGFLAALVFSSAVACNFSGSASLESKTEDSKNSESTTTEPDVISANSTETQKLKGSGDTEGVTVSFPPGSLAIDAPVSIEAAGNISSGALGELGLSASVTQAGTAIILDTTSDTDPIGTLALELPTPVNAGLVQSEGHLVVIYRIVIKATGEYRTGIIPPSEFTSFEPGKGVVTISTKYFGQFQTVYLDIAITEKVEVKSATAGFLDAAGDVKKSSTKPQSDAPTTNTTTTTLKATPDTTKPVVELATSTPTYTSLATIQFKATLSEEISDFQADDISTTSGSVAGFAKVNNTYQFTIASPTEGELTVFVNANAVKDAAGNLSEKSNTIQVTVDRTPPVIAITTPQGSTVTAANAIAFSVAGTCSEVGKNVTVTVANSPMTTACSAAGTFTQTLNVGSTPGERVIQAILTDESGNSATSQLTMHVSELLTVGPKYTVAPHWMDHVQSADPTAACTGTENSATAKTACVDGGPLRKFTVSSEADCAGLTATDNLDYFRWDCQDHGATVSFYGTLRSELGIRDLIVAAGTSFKNNYVSVTKNSVTIAASTAEAWWANTFEVVDSSGSTISLPGSGDQIGRIYTITSNATAPNVAFDADEVALIVMPTASLEMIPPGDFNCAGTSMDSALNTKCLIYVGGRKFARVEGRFLNDPSRSASLGILIKNSKFVTVASADMVGFGNDGYGKGLQVISTDGFVGRNLKINDTNGKGFGLENVDHVAMEDIYVVNSADGGGSILNGTFGVIRRATFAGSSWQNLKIETATRWTVSEILAVSSNDTTYGIGMDYYYNDWLVVQGATTALNKKSGVSVDLNTNFVLSGVLSFNNQKGFTAVSGTPDDIKVIGLADILSTNSYYFPNTYLTGTTLGPTPFLQQVVSGSDCTLTAFPGPPTCTVVTGKETTFGTPTAGTTASATDFLNVNNRWSHWGLSGSVTNSDETNRGWCFSTDTCQQYDWRVNSTPNGLAFANGTFTPGAACPVNGSRTFTGPDGPALQYANEILFDEKGDDDGLCEANETCLFMPHIGGFQGDGGYTAPCTFSQSGGIGGVTLVSYQTTHR